MLNSSLTRPSGSIVPDPTRKWCRFELGRSLWVVNGGASALVHDRVWPKFEPGSEVWVGPSDAVERLVARDGAELAYLECEIRSSLMLACTINGVLHFLYRSRFGEKFDLASLFQKNSPLHQLLVYEPIKKNPELFDLTSGRNQYFRQILWIFVESSLAKLFVTDSEIICVWTYEKYPKFFASTPSWKPIFLTIITSWDRFQGVAKGCGRKDAIVDKNAENWVAIHRGYSHHLHSKTRPFLYYQIWHFMIKTWQTNLDSS